MGQQQIATQGDLRRTTMISIRSSMQPPRRRRALSSPSSLKWSVRRAWLILVAELAHGWPPFVRMGWRMCWASMGVGCRGLGRRFDLAVSLETAEHLAPECATTLVASLVGLAPAVLFSAAVPGQGGTDHRNLQWPRYWSELFADHDFVTIDAVRPLLCRRSEVAHWYVQNTFLFVDRRHAARDEILRSLHAAHGGPPFPWIHQDYWDGPADSFAREMRHVRAALFTPVDLTLT